jgi:WD40 repeat protein
MFQKPFFSKDGSKPYLFSPDGETLAITASWPNSFMLWNLNEETPRTLYQSWSPFNTSTVNWVGFPFPGGANLVESYDGSTVKYWNSKTCESVGEFYFGGDPTGFWIGPGGQIIAKVLRWLRFLENVPTDSSGVEAIGIVVYEREADNPHGWKLRHHDEGRRFHHKEVPAGWHKQWIDAVQIGADNRIVSVSLFERTIKSWNAETGEVDATISLDYQIVSRRNLLCVPVFSADLSTLAIAAKNSVTLFEVATGKVRGGVPCFPESVNALAFSQNGSTLAIGGNNQGTVGLLNVGTGQFHVILEGKKCEIRSLAFAPDGGRLAVGGRKFITVCDLKS